MLALLSNRVLNKHSSFRWKSYQLHFDLPLSLLQLLKYDEGKKKEISMDLDKVLESELY